MSASMVDGEEKIERKIWWSVGGRPTTDQIAFEIYTLNDIGHLGERADVLHLLVSAELLEIISKWFWRRPEMLSMSDAVEWTPELLVSTLSLLYVWTI